jgi:hypothetical protein
MPVCNGYSFLRDTVRVNIRARTKKKRYKQNNFIQIVFHVYDFISFFTACQAVFSMSPTALCPPLSSRYVNRRQAGGVAGASGGAANIIPGNTHAPKTINSTSSLCAVALYHICFYFSY